VEVTVQLAEMLKSPDQAESQGQNFGLGVATVA